MTRCIPWHVVPRQRKSLGEEFARRAVNVYDEGGTWMDLLGGNYLYANRFVYHYYMYTLNPDEFLEYVSMDEKEENVDFAINIDRIWDIPVNDWIRTEFPIGVERAGVVTSPMFLQRFNNFRTRIRALTENLLCRDVDGTSNIDGNKILHNPDLDELTLTHPTDPLCALCHYPMDNMGSTIMQWEEEAELYHPLSTVGHVFGKTGEGPSFLMRGYIERAPEFFPCMAKRAWESFSGVEWDLLTKTQQASFIEYAKAGPRSLLQGVMLSPLMRLLRY